MIVISSQVCREHVSPPSSLNWGRLTSTVLASMALHDAWQRQMSLVHWDLLSLLLSGFVLTPPSLQVEVSIYTLAPDRFSSFYANVEPHHNRFSSPFSMASCLLLHSPYFFTVLFIGINRNLLGPPHLPLAFFKGRVVWIPGWSWTHYAATSQVQGIVSKWPRVYHIQFMQCWGWIQGFLDAGQILYFFSHFLKRVYWCHSLPNLPFLYL